MDQMVADSHSLAKFLPESAVLRLCYRRRGSGRPWIQKIEARTEDVGHRIFDLVLLSWGNSKFVSDLEFFMALDETGGILVTGESLVLYVAYTLRDVKAEIAATISTEKLPDEVDHVM